MGWSAADCGAQIRPYHHFDAADGLINNTVYVIQQDSMGRIWMGTEGGVSVFDGADFNSYALTDGLNSNTVVGLGKADDGGMYVIHYTKGLNHIDLKGEISGKRKSPFSFSFGLTDGENVYLLRASDIVLRTSLNRFMTDPDQAKLDTLFTEKTQFSSTWNATVLCNQSGVFLVRNNEFIQAAIDTQHRYYCATVDEAGAIWGITADALINTSSKKSVSIAPLDGESISRMQIDQTGGVWMVSEGQLYLLSDGRLVNLSARLDMASTTVNSLFRDREGNIWVSTGGKGAFCFFNHFITQYSGSEGLIHNTITSIEPGPLASVFFGTRSGFSLLDTNNVFHNSSKSAFVYQGALDGEELIVCGALPEEPVEEVMGVKCQWKRVSNILIQEDHTRVIAGPNRIRFFYPDKGVREIFYPPFAESGENRVDAIRQDSQGKLWLGSRLGLVYTNNECTETFRPDVFPEYLNTHIHDIFIDQQLNETWIACDRGLVIAKNEQFVPWAWEGPSPGGCFAIEKDDFGRHWIGCNRGLYVIENGRLLFVFDKFNGLSDFRVVALYYDTTRDVMWVGTDDGVSRLSISQSMFEATAPPVVYIKQFGSFRLPGMTKESFSLETGETSFNVNFQAITFATAGDVSYEYWIDHPEDAQLSTEGKVFLKAVGFGSHTFWVRARVGQGPWGTPASVRFVIPTPLFLTWWFGLGVLAVFFALVFIVIRWRWRIIRRRSLKQIDVKEQILKLRQQALASSINPHFIFNALNSIQYLVGSEESYKAHEYIARLGKLIRSNLESAKQSSATLQSELDRLQLYFELEQLRIGTGVSLRIDISAEIQPAKLRIPIMIIQPFVENSIWHGLAPSGAQGQVRIKVLMVHNSVLRITVEDNGVGLKESQTKAVPGHQSMGIRMIEERLDIANNGRVKSIELTDLSALDPALHGTRVVISLAQGAYERLV